MMRLRLKNEGVLAPGNPATGKKAPQKFRCKTRNNEKITRHTLVFRALVGDARRLNSSVTAVTYVFFCLDVTINRLYLWTRLGQGTRGEKHKLKSVC